MNVTEHQAGLRSPTLAGLGWGPFFEDQIGPEDAALEPRRIAAVHRARLTAMSDTGLVRLAIPSYTETGLFAVGDWVLIAPGTEALGRRLTRRTVMERHVPGSATPQLVAANVDTLFIVTSHNADLNLDRLERYLALAIEGGVDPVILLTKGDSAADPDGDRSRVAALKQGLTVLTLDPRSTGAVDLLAPWCGPGKTVAVVGSSGVGKSTLVNTLSGPGREQSQLTGGVRSHDDKGRHTTTARSLHAMAGGGWVIDTPGMRTLNVGDSAHGIEVLFAEITALAPSCRFSDCTHVHEPGCAIRAAVADGTLDAGRVARWRTLSDENRGNTAVESGPRGNRVPAGRPRKG